MNLEILYEGFGQKAVNSVSSDRAVVMAGDELLSFSDSFYVGFNVQNVIEFYDHPNKYRDYGRNYLSSEIVVEHLIFSSDEKNSATLLLDGYLLLGVLLYRHELDDKFMNMKSDVIRAWCSFEPLVSIHLKTAPAHINYIRKWIDFKLTCDKNYAPKWLLASQD